MTPAREAALMAVLKAVETVMETLTYSNSYPEVKAALEAFYALPPAPPPGETVLIRGCLGRTKRDDGSLDFYAYCSSTEPDDELISMVRWADYDPVAMFTTT